MYNINRRKFLGYFGCGCCSLLLPSCSTVPITERKQLSIIPESRINAQAANIFLIDEKNQTFQCIASKHQAYLEDFEIPITQGVMGKAALMKKCIRVGDVRKDIREIAEFYFDLDNKTNFTTIQFYVHR